MLLQGPRGHSQHSPNRWLCRRSVNHRFSPLNPDEVNSATRPSAKSKTSARYTICGVLLCFFSFLFFFLFYFANRSGGCESAAMMRFYTYHHHYYLGGRVYEEDEGKRHYPEVGYVGLMGAC